jgi:dipeptide/tripeptide permease
MAIFCLCVYAGIFVATSIYLFCCGLWMSPVTWTTVFPIASTAMLARQAFVYYIRISTLEDALGLPARRPIWQRFRGFDEE